MGNIVIKKVKLHKCKHCGKDKPRDEFASFGKKISNTCSDCDFEQESQLEEEFNEQFLKQMPRGEASFD
jgi:hypothetical protein